MNHFSTCAALLVLTITLTITSHIAVAQKPAEKIFRQWDRNGDGQLERHEIPPGPRKSFAKKDANRDGKVTLEEHLNQTKPQRIPNIAPTFTITQTWPQEPAGFDRPIYLKEPSAKTDKTPVVIYFHGNGGNAGTQINHWAQTFPNRIVVAPQGYLKSWNIQGEKSEAPDFEFFKTLISEIGKRHPYADMKNVSLIGSSNGGGYIYRLMIEDREGLFQQCVVMVASLIKSQYHGGTFWKPSGSTATYDTKVTPIGGRKFLYIHGSSDKVVPFHGGLRFGKHLHLSAAETAFALAQTQGYRGAKLNDAQGEEISPGMIRYQYKDADVTFIKVVDGKHSLQPHREAARQLVGEFLK